MERQRINVFWLSIAKFFLKVTFMCNNLSGNVQVIRALGPRRQPKMRTQFPIWELHMGMNYDNIWVSTTLMPIIHFIVCLFLE